MRTGHKLSLLAGATIVATAAMAQPPGQKVTGPIAVYWMSAATQSGFGMPGAGGGGRPSATDIMKMMQGGGGAQHTLTLQLGSSQAPQGPPHAEHLPPPALAAGDSLPLVTPKPVAVHEEEPERPQIPREYQKPRGKMLIFWGCGEHAGPGQPVVIDFSQMTPEKMQAGQMPAGMAALSRMIAAQMRPPSPSRNKTYGDWPNAEARTSVSPQSSLVGDHVVRGDYSPDIKFSLRQDQDFLGPLTLTTNAKLPSGAVQLGWPSVPNAQAYVASFMGSAGQDTVVMWVSSETQAAGFALPDYISNAELARLVQARTLMGADATSCAVPKEAVDAGRQGLVQMVAYGREANFAWPERPRDPKVPWNIAWEVKVRYRSATGGMLGQPMPSMGGGRGRGGGYPGQGQDGDRAQAPPPQTPAEAAAARRKAILQGLGGLIPH